MEDVTSEAGKWSCCFFQTLFCPCAAAAKCQRSMVRGLEKFYFKFGEFVAKHYVVFTLFPVLVALVASLGISQLVTEDEFLRMWVPEENYHRINSEWLDLMESTSPGMVGGPRPKPRTNYVLVKAEEKNVLTGKAVELVARLRETLVSAENSTWEKICIRKSLRPLKKLPFPLSQVN